MSQSNGDAPTGPPTSAPHPGSARRRHNVARDMIAGALVVIAVFLPWNLYFGIGIPHRNHSVSVLLLAVTLLSLGAIAVTYLGPARIGRFRLALNVPYLLFVSAFVVFDVFETIRFGSTVHVPGGVGPGCWLGLTGALLSAQPLTTAAGAGAGDAPYRSWLRAAQILGYGSMFGATLSAGFNLYWRIKYALQPSDTSDFGKQNIVVIATSVTYGLIALITLLVASWWLLRETKDYRLSIVALGASTLIAGIIVWFLPIGREIDGFHGIAQNTSTAGVGYEGYLAWVAGAAIFAPRTLLSIDKGTRWAAARHALLLIAVWCLGSVAMRLTDLGGATILHFPFSRYDTMALATFDMATALLAIWLRVNLAKEALPARLISSLSGFIFTLTISRVIVGIVLAPRFQDSPHLTHHAVYGNNLAQQITSIFDVVLCGLAFCILAAAITTGPLRGQQRRYRPAVAPPPPSTANKNPTKQSLPKLYRPADGSA